MIRTIVHKLLEVIPTLLAISVFAFVLIRLAPGDPVQLMLGERGSDPAQYHAMKTHLGLDLPVYRQYWNFMSRAVRGDLGVSVVTRHSVAEELFSRWPATLELGASALVIALVTGIPIGIFAALKRNSIWDRILMGLSTVGYSMPIFWWGMVLVITFSIQLGWTPVSGRIDVLYDVAPWTGFLLIDSLQTTVINQYGYDAFWSTLSHLILPSIAMGTIPLAIFAKMMRSSLLDVLGENYVRAARARGLSSFVVIGRHALRNALIPVITVGGILFISTVITGAILTETIFSWPGMGSYIVSSVNARDYPVIQGCIVLMGCMIVLINSLVEFMYVWANPKMRR
jgi:dipeptide transport system permease protein